MNLKRFGAAAIAALAALGLAACSGGDAGSDGTAADGTTTLKVATVGLTQDAGISLGVDQGYFASRGITLEVTVVANPPAALAAVQSGQVDVAYTPSIPFLNARSQGVPVQIVAAADGYPEGASTSGDPASIDDTGVVVNPSSGIASVADLAGKTVAVPARNAQMEVTIAAAIKDAGGDPKAVNWVVLDFASAVEAVKGGTVDAAGLVNPFYGDAVSQGMKLIASPGLNFFQEGAVGLWVTGEQTATNKAEAIAGFRDAVYESNAYANEHMGEAKARGKELTGVSMPVEEMTDVYWPGAVKREEIARVNDRLVELGYLQAPVDLSNIFTDGAESK